MLPTYFSNQTKLLQKDHKGQTQIANDAINSLLWSRRSKLAFYGKSKLKACAAIPITEWNKDSPRWNGVFKKLVLIVQSTEISDISK